MCTNMRAILSHQLYYHLASFHFEYNENHSLVVHVCLLSTLSHLCDTTHRHTHSLFAVYCSMWTKLRCFSAYFFSEKFRILRLYPSGPHTMMIFRMFLHLDEWKMMNVTITQKNWYIITCNNNRTTYNVNTHMNDYYGLDVILHEKQ